MATVQEIFNELDKMLKEKTDREVIDWLVEQTQTFMAENPNDLVGQSALFSEIGGFYRARGIYDASESAFLHAKTLLESMGATSSGNYATVLNNLAGLYRLTKDYDKAIEFFDKAIDIYENLDFVPPDVHASVYNNKGLVYQDQGEYYKAGKCFGAALEIIVNTPNNTYPLATTYSNFAFCCFGDGKKEEACDFMNKAIELYAQVLAPNDPMFIQCMQIRDAMENAIK